MESTLLQHLIKAQFYRWFQVYERPVNVPRIESQLELLVDEIIIDNPLSGERRGKAACAEALLLLTNSKNAHHVSDICIIVQDEAKALLTATVHYQNIRPDNERFSYAISYSVIVDINGKNLPFLSKVTIQPIEQTQEIFEDTYPTNRVKSLIHYWLALVERLESDPEPFCELLADQFQLNFPSGLLTSKQDLETWILKSSTQLRLSAHIVDFCHVEVVSENEYRAVFECSWKGITLDGKQLTAVTRHTWDILNDPDVRFSQIKSAYVEAIQPFIVVGEDVTSSFVLS